MNTVKLILIIILSEIYVELNIFMFRDSGFTCDLLSYLFNTQYVELQKSIMNVVVECCRPRPNVNNQILCQLYKTTIIHLKLLPKILQFLISDTIELAVSAADILLYIFNADSSTEHVTILDQKQIQILFTAIKKFQ